MRVCWRRCGSLRVRPTAAQRARRERWPVRSAGGSGARSTRPPTRALNRRWGSLDAALQPACSTGGACSTQLPAQALGKRRRGSSTRTPAHALGLRRCGSLNTIACQRAPAAVAATTAQSGRLNSLRLEMEKTEVRKRCCGEEGRGLGPSER
jgi:hypothetical protein